MFSIRSNELGLTREQVKMMMGDSCPTLVWALNPGDVLTWTCGHYDSRGRCDFKLVVNVTERMPAPIQWDERLIDHIWKEGHLTIDSYGGRPMPVDTGERRQGKWFHRHRKVRP